MADKILGFDPERFYAIVLLLLLIILGIVSFHYYAYISARDGLSVGTGIGLSIYPNRRRRLMPDEEGKYY